MRRVWVSERRRDEEVAPVARAHGSGQSSVQVESQSTSGQQDGGQGRTEWLTMMIEYRGGGECVDGGGWGLR